MALIDDIERLLSGRSSEASGDTLALRLTALVAAMEDGRLDRAAFESAFRAELAGSYLRAYTSSLGPDHQISSDDITAVSRLVARQVPHIASFATDIGAGTGVMPTAARVDLYSASLHGVAQAGAVTAIALDGGDSYEWIADEDESTCDPCQQAADGSPYTADTLPGTPGYPFCDGGNRCRCEIVPG